MTVPPRGTETHSAFTSHPTDRGELLAMQTLAFMKTSFMLTSFHGKPFQAKERGWQALIVTIIHRHVIREPTHPFALTAGSHPPVAIK